eukprot:scaffold1457_cov350-Prasinococcus_capsulatus_cf.AAC.13
MESQAEKSVRAGSLTQANPFVVYTLEYIGLPAAGSTVLTTDCCSRQIRGMETVTYIWESNALGIQGCIGRGIISCSSSESLANAIVAVVLANLTVNSPGQDHTLITQAWNEDVQKMQRSFLNSANEEMNERLGRVYSPVFSKLEQRTYFACDAKSLAADVGSSHTATRNLHELLRLESEAIVPVFARLLMPDFVRYQTYSLEILEIDHASTQGDMEDPGLSNTPQQPQYSCHSLRDSLNFRLQSISYFPIKQRPGLIVETARMIMYAYSECKQVSHKQVVSAIAQVSGLMGDIRLLQNSLEVLSSWPGGPQDSNNHIRSDSRRDGTQAHEEVHGDSDLLLRRLEMAKHVDSLLRDYALKRGDFTESSWLQEELLTVPEAARWSSSSNEEITAAVILTMDRFTALERCERSMRAVSFVALTSDTSVGLCTRWPGPIAAVVYREDSPAAFKYSMEFSMLTSFVRSAHSRYKCKLDLAVAYNLACVNGSVHSHDASGTIFYERYNCGAFFPTNQLRNFARNRVKTDLFLMIDVDFVPSPTLYQRLHESIDHVKKLCDRNAVVVIPTYRSVHSQLSQLPNNYNELLDHMWEGSVSTDSKVVELLPGQILHHHHRNDTTFKINPLSGYSPSFVASVKQLPHFSELFRGYTADVIYFHHSLQILGYQYHVFARGMPFLIHASHPESPASTAMTKDRSVLAKTKGKQNTMTMMFWLLGHCYESKLLCEVGGQELGRRARMATRSWIDRVNSGQAYLQGCPSGEWNVPMLQQSADILRSIVASFPVHAGTVHGQAGKTRPDASMLVGSIHDAAVGYVDLSSSAWRYDNEVSPRHRRVAKSFSLVVPITPGDLLPGFLSSVMKTIQAQVVLPSEVVIILSAASEKPVPEAALPRFVEAQRESTQEFCTALSDYCAAHFEAPPSVNGFLIPCRVFCVPALLSVADARKMGAKLSKHDVISFADGDDPMHPQRVRQPWNPELRM